MESVCSRSALGWRPSNPRRICEVLRYNPIMEHSLLVVASAPQVVTIWRQRDPAGEGTIAAVPPEDRRGSRGGAHHHPETD